MILYAVLIIGLMLMFISRKKTNEFIERNWFEWRYSAPERTFLRAFDEALVDLIDQRDYYGCIFENFERERSMKIGPYRFDNWYYFFNKISNEIFTREMTIYAEDETVTIDGHSRWKLEVAFPKSLDRYVEVTVTKPDEQRAHALYVAADNLMKHTMNLTEEDFQTRLKEADDKNVFMGML